MPVTNLRHKPARYGWRGDDEAGGIGKDSCCKECNTCFHVWDVEVEHMNCGHVDHR